MKTILINFSIYYFITGIWPLIYYKSFEKITGPKIDRWLVYTVSLLLLTTSIVMFYSSINNTPVPKETIILALGNCISLTTIDIFFSYKKIISKIYLLDAFVEIIFASFIVLNLYK